MGEWQLVPIGEIAALYDAPHQTAPLDPSGPVTYLNVGDIRGGRIAINLSGRVSEATATEWTRRVQPRAGDVVFGYEAKVGEAAMLTDEHRWCLGRRVGLLRPDPRRLDPRYLSYVWYSNHFQETLRAHRIGGTTIESIRLTDLPRWTIPLPPLGQQRRIAGILGALDDRIELNHRMSAHLERAAGLMFERLFGAAVADSGRAPRTRLGDVTELVRGCSYQSADLVPSRTALVTLKSFARGGGYQHQGLKAFAGRYKDAQVVRPGEVVVAVTDVTQAAEVVGRPAMVRPTNRFDRLVVSQDVVIVRPTSSQLTNTFLYFALRGRSFAQHTSGYASGTTVLHLDTRCIPAFEFSMPELAAVRRWEAAAEPMTRRAVVAEQQAFELAAMRDLLIPRLLAGEMR